MEKTQAMLAFSALAHPTRLDVFRLLVEREPSGLPAGEIAQRMAVPHNTMSAHLAVLARAGLVAAERRSRSIIYRARLTAVRALADYLIDDCCAGRQEICTPFGSGLADRRPANTATTETRHD